MPTDRRKISQAEEVGLVAQVSSACPECGGALFYKKGRRSYKQYDIAHIYPLNPTTKEVALLAGEERLAGDVNDADNLIPLCLNCHGKFDKPRTVAEYRVLLQKKREAIFRSQQQKLQQQYVIEEDIRRVIQALDVDDWTPSPVELALNAKPISEKFDDTMPPPTRRKIHHNVSDYFVQVRRGFQSLDREKPGIAELISSQVKAFYLAQKQKGWDQQQIYAGVVEWIVTKTRPRTTEAAEIMASFFIQNCEVFE